VSLAQRRVLLCVAGADDAARLAEIVTRLIGDHGAWLAVHVVDTRPRVDLGLLRSGIPGAGRLGDEQRRAIEQAAAEQARAVLARAAQALTARGLSCGGSVQRTGEPGREICAAAGAERVDLVALFARRRPGPPVGPPSVGHTARFVLDHAPCPVLLLRRTLHERRNSDAV
jgi:nucleotide-binding universal stress UspA family protein